METIFLNKITLVLLLLFILKPSISQCIKYNENQWIIPFTKHIPIYREMSWKHSGECYCGVASKRNSNERIVGGILSKPNAWPWMGAIVFVGFDSPKLLCGASVINSRYLITAGHCGDYVKAEGIQKFRVFLGTNDLNDEEKIVPEIESIIIHPKYNRKTRSYDAALIKLKKELIFSSYVSPVCIFPQTGVPYTNKSSIVAGWGSTSYGEIPATMQMQAMVNITSNKSCKEKYNKSIEPVEITPQMMCASSPGSDSCQGDSGGALFIQRRSSDIFEQIGIVSFGNGCADENFPGVYTRIGKILPWIKSVTIGSKYCKVKP